MKVVCDTCGTRYSIDDNRVAGKTFKIRCKKCSGVIIVRDTRAGVTESVPDAGAWHVVLGGTQAGPMALAELRRLRTAGELDNGSLIWREGFDDWRALGTVDELRDAGPSSVEVAPEATDAPEAANTPEAAATANAPALARPALRSERNETSVLFTLGNLARLAAPAPSAASPATGGEGSGFLDIRSLARSLAPAPTAAPAHHGSFGDLPLYAPVTFVEPTVLVPGSPHRKDRRLVWALAGSIGALAIVATVLVVVVMRDGASAHAAAMPPVTSTTPTRPRAAPARRRSQRRRQRQRPPRLPPPHPRSRTMHPPHPRSHTAHPPHPHAHPHPMHLRRSRTAYPPHPRPRTKHPPQRSPRLHPPHPRSGTVHPLQRHRAARSQPRPVAHPDVHHRHRPSRHRCRSSAPRIHVAR